MERIIKDGYTRVSTISGAFGGYGGIPAAILKNAANRGTAVHEIIKDLILDIPVAENRFEFMNQKPNGDLEKISLKGYVDSFWIFWKPIEARIVPVLIEEEIENEVLMVTGQPDYFGKLDNRTILFDWKCTSKNSTNWDIQANGYVDLYEPYYNDVVEEMNFVRLDKDGKEPEIVELVRDLDLFSNCHGYYHRYFKNQINYLEKE